jgi:hypothetical protein
MRLATCKGLIMGTIFDFATIDMDCTILKFIFSLASKLSAYIYYLLSVATCSKEKIKKERKKKVPSTSTCKFNVHSTFICFRTLSLSVKHLCSEQDVPLHISFACCYSLKFHSFILCIFLAIFIQTINSKVHF